MRKAEHLKEYRFARTTGRQESCIKKLTVKITPSMNDALATFGKEKAEFVRQAIEEKLERENSWNE